MADSPSWPRRSAPATDHLCFSSFRTLKKRFKRRLRYHAHDSLDRLSFPLSEVATDYFQQQAPFDYLPLDFATNLSREACVHPCAFVMALIYLERLRASDVEHFNCSDPAELYVTALLLASKFVMDDGLEEFVYNDEWACSSGLDLTRINQLEIDFLSRIGWNLGLKFSAFEKMMEQIEAKIAVSSLERGDNVTYSDLVVISGALEACQSLSALVGILLRPILEALAVVTVGLAATVVSLGAVSFAVHHSCSTPTVPAVPYVSPPSLCPFSLETDCGGLPLGGSSVHSIVLPAPRFPGMMSADLGIKSVVRIDSGRGSRCQNHRPWGSRHWNHGKAGGDVVSLDGFSTLHDGVFHESTDEEDSLVLSRLDGPDWSTDDVSKGCPATSLKNRRSRSSLLSELDARHRKDGNYRSWAGTSGYAWGDRNRVWSGFKGGLAWLMGACAHEKGADNLFVFDGLEPDAEGNLLGSFGGVLMNDSASLFDFGRLSRDYRSYR